MEVIFLGTGTGAPSVKRGAPGLVVLTRDSNVLIDGGSGTLRQLARAGISYGAIDHILFTHFHPDHVSELGPYLFATRYACGFTRYDPVRVYGPEGLLKIYSCLREAFGHSVEPPENLVLFSELPIGRRQDFTCGRITIESGPVPHARESLGYRLTEPGGPTLVVTGDTDYGPDLIALAQHADLLITECSFPEGQKKDKHLTPRLAGRAARQAGVKALALTHFYPETEGHDLASEVMKEYDGPLVLAEDLMRLEV